MTATRNLQRLVFPVDRDTDVFALYVDPEHPCSTPTSTRSAPTERPRR